MRILSRYLLREHLGPFLFALCALTGLLVLNQLARQFANLIGKGLGWDVIGTVFGLSLPFIFAMTLPMAALVAALHAFGRLAADNEVTALKATGVHLGRALLPVLAAAALLAAFELLFVDQVLPRANHRLKNLLIDIARVKPTFELKEQMVNEVSGQLFLRAGRIDQAADRMRDVVIYDLADPNRRRTIYADSGFIRFSADQTDLYLTLFDGYVHDYDRAQATVFRRVFFDTDIVRVAGVSNRLERTGVSDLKGDREMSLCEMEAIVAADHRALAGMDLETRQAVVHDAWALAGRAPPADADTVLPGRFSLTAVYCRLLARISAGLVPAELRAQEGPATTARPARPLVPPRPALMAPDPTGGQLRGRLHQLETRRRAARQHSASFQVEIHKKYSLALSCIVFVLVGAPVALRFPRGGVGLVVGASVAIFGIYYIGLIGGESLADRLVIPPFWAMWGPNLIMGTAGLWLFSRLGYETATSRGGGVGSSRVDLQACKLEYSIVSPK